MDNPKLIIDKILEIYRRFSLVSRLKNNDTKIVYGTRFDKNDIRIVALTNYLTKRHGAHASNVRIKGDEIILLGDTLLLSIDEAEDNAGFIDTSRVESWNGISNKFLMNIFARATVAKTF